MPTHENSMSGKVEHLVDVNDVVSVPAPFHTDRKQQYVSAAVQTGFVGLFLWYWSFTRAMNAEVIVAASMIISTVVLHLLACVGKLSPALPQDRVVKLTDILGSVSWGGGAALGLLASESMFAPLAFGLFAIIGVRATVGGRGSTYAWSSLLVAAGPAAVMLLALPAVEAKAISLGLLAFAWAVDYFVKDRQPLSPSKSLAPVVLEPEYSKNMLSVSEQTLVTILQNMGAGAAICDQNMRFLYWNDAYNDLMGISPEWMSTNRTVIDLVYYHAEQGEYDEESVKEAVELRTEQFNRVVESGTVDSEMIRPSGVVVHVRRVPLPGKLVLTVMNDVSESRKATTEALVHLYQHDALTGLPNRIKFRRELDKTINHAKRNKSLVSIMILNLDHFKDINNTMGHAVGDELLGVVARRLKDCSRNTDIVARLGSDEFAIIGTNAKTPSDINLMASRLIDEIRNPVEIDDKKFNVGVSIGVTVFPNDKGNSDQLMRNAELALYRAKQEGRNNYQLFSRNMHTEVQERTTLERDLRDSLNTDAFLFHYQPQVDLITRKVVGVEALMRWKHKTRGWVGPDQFIPVAEASRLIIPLTESLVPEACLRTIEWHEMGFPLTMAINLSPVHFRATDTLKWVSDLLKTTKLRPGSLELEITEGMVMQDSENVIKTLGKLDKLGVKLAIDDFGTGYSSLSYLKKFPVGKLKIDKSFVNDVPHDLGATAIVKAVIKLGHSFGLKVIAEGVETEEQLEFLAKLGCDEVQGYYYSKPLPADELTKWLMAQK